jgi:hypothetical protein
MALVSGLSDALRSISRRLGANKRGNFRAGAEAGAALVLGE